LTLSQLWLEYKEKHPGGYQYTQFCEHYWRWRKKLDYGMVRSLEARLADPKHGTLSHDEFVGLLVQDEKLYRDNLRLHRLLKKAKLRQEASLEDIDYVTPRGLSQQVMTELASPEWVPACRNVLVSGPARRQQVGYRLHPGQLRRPRRLYRVA
jgi:hypothetical protein